MDVICKFIVDTAGPQIKAMITDGSHSYLFVQDKPPDGKKCEKMMESLRVSLVLIF